MMKHFLFLILIFPMLLNAQTNQKKQLTADDYAGWKRIGNSKISNSGNLTVYELNPQKGDGQLMIYSLATGSTTVINRGKKPEIGPDDNFILYTLVQSEDTLRKAKLKKVKKEEMPQDSLGILLLKTNTTYKYPRLKLLGISEENATWIVFTATPEVKKDTSKTAKKVKTIKQPGDDLILFSTKSSDTLMFKSATEFFCPKKGGSVYFVQQRKDSLLTYSSVKRFDTGKAMVSELFSSEGFVKKIVADETGEDYSFLFSKDTASVKCFSLYLGKVSRNEPHLIADKDTRGMPSGWSPSENGTLWFSRDASKLYFGTAKTPVPEPKDTLLDEEKSKVDIWNWKDLTLQSQQKVDLDKEKKKNFTALFDLTSEKFIQLADTVVTRVSTFRKGDSDLLLGEDDRPYRRAQSWTGNALADFYLIDAKTGKRHQVAVGKERVSLSPAGNYMLWYEQTDSSYYVRPTGSDNAAIRSLTRLIPVRFFDERNDLPDDPRPYGIAGWSAEDKYVFIYDRFDIWKIDPSGKQAPVCVTRGYGRKHHLQFRYLKTDKEEEFIPSGKISLLSAFDMETMASGFFSCDLYTAKEPSQQLMSSHFYGAPLKAAHADRIIWTKESVSDYPDLWTSNLMFENPQCISHANPQQKEYNWLSVELVEWISFTGDTLKGLLYKPENLDVTQKYPMVVYYYERNAETLNRYSVPSPSKSIINRPFYCSNGYLVFVPDITYRIGYPGQSAYDAVVSGVYHLANTRPYVDLPRIGLQGHSWGGYQTAWLITRTDMFAAAMAGAPVSNMTSAYGGIRWESGNSRMAQYEHTQSRIGGTLWDKPMLYIENSPLFSAPKVNTPLLMMHNDYDGAVPWYQGIEFFVALRRLNKPAWMLTYNGEAHNLKDESWANRMDLDKRMFQFFNHFLKGEPMPAWMGKGVPAIEKGSSN
jgi:dienelactone hydrolase